MNNNNNQHYYNRGRYYNRNNNNNDYNYNYQEEESTDYDYYYKPNNQQRNRYFGNPQYHNSYNYRQKQHNNNHRNNKQGNRIQIEQGMNRLSLSPQPQHKKEVIIAKFDTKQLLQSKSKKLETNIELKTFYHTNPAQKLLEFNDSIKPMMIKSEKIECLLNMDFNEILINYSTLKNKEKNKSKRRFIKTLYQQRPPKCCWNNTSRIDPFCHEITKIDKAMNDTNIKNNNNNNNNDINNDDSKSEMNKTRFITYRHNLRSIANVVLFKLAHMKIYESCGINIGIHRKGNDIFLENITELEVNNKPWFNVNCVYGFLLEHTLETLSNNDNDNDEKQIIEPMDYQKSCIDRNEIRALNQLTINNDISVLCAAEMDSIMTNNDKDNTQIVELKCSKIATKRRFGKEPKVAGIPDFKLLKFWTQCRFGGVDSLIIAFHDGDGIISKTKTLNTKQIEALFPIITNKCIIMLYQILKWISNVVMKLPENNLYLLSFDTKNKENSEFVFKYLRSKQTEKQVFEILSEKNEDEKDKMLNHGLVINAKTKRIEIKTILSK